MIENSLARFFTRLFCYSDGYVEIRPIPGSQAYFDPTGADVISGYLKRHEKSNVFFGVGTRDGKGGKLENVLQIPALWCDCDFKTISRADLYDRLNRFICKPTMIVKSGNGVHFYWLLSEPAGPEDFARVVDANKRIAARLGGDPAATDAARVLRPPETLNHKYRPPRPVELTVCDRFEYELQFFLDDLPKVSSAGGSTGTKNPPGWLIDALKGVAQHTTGRNPTGAKIAGYFINKLPARDIIAILTAWNCHNTPPLKQSEIPKIVKSVSKYKTTKRSADYEVDLQIE